MNRSGDVRRIRNGKPIVAVRLRLPFGSKEYGVTEEPELAPGLSFPGTTRIEPDSPVQAALALIERFLSSSPDTDMGDTDSARAGAVVGNHFCVLLRGCGALNASGLHSASLVLFRSLQDALDVFAAVTSVAGTAREWEQDKLKPSDAAKAYVAQQGNPRLHDAGGKAMTLSDYRRSLRSDLNRYSHGSYALCAWDLYYFPRKPNPSGSGSCGTLEINHDRHVIDANAHSIDASMTATLLEFIAVLARSFSRVLEETNLGQTLAELRRSIENIMDDHTKHRCQDVSLPPEIRRVTDHRGTEPNQASG